MFIAACYGSKCNGIMCQMWFNIWQSKTGCNKTTYFKLPSVPPTSEAFGLHARRALHQACIWRAVLCSDLSVLGDIQYGWLADYATETTLPVALPAANMHAPAGVSSLLCCTCRTKPPCSNRKCSCHRSGMTCSISIMPISNCENPVNNHTDLRVMKKKI